MICNKCGEVFDKLEVSAIDNMVPVGCAYCFDCADKAMEEYQQSCAKLLDDWI